MESDLEILYRTKAGGDIGADQCARINRALAVVDFDDIPNDERENVKDYLTSALNMNSVEPGLEKRLDKLLEQLQRAGGT